MKSIVKTLINGSIDERIEAINELTLSRLKVLLGNVEEIPEQFDYILADVTLKRFNRIGNEGMQSFSQEGESIHFFDSDFAEYMDEINSFKEETGKGASRKGGVMFF